jgi:hypothetical protein
LISASGVARITGMSHWRLVRWLLKNGSDNFNNGGLLELMFIYAPFSSKCKFSEFFTVLLSLLHNENVAKIVRKYDECSLSDVFPQAR